MRRLGVSSSLMPSSVVTVRSLLKCPSDEVFATLVRWMRPPKKCEAFIQRTNNLLRHFISSTLLLLVQRVWRIRRCMDGWTVWGELTRKAMNARDQAPTALGLSPDKGEARWCNLKPD